MQRRDFLALTSCAALAALGRSSQASSRGSSWHLPEEGSPHARTWMGFVAQRRIWGRRMVHPVLRDLARIANTISDYEPVSLLSPSNLVQTAREYCSERVEIIPMELDDFWVRDTGPTFVLNDQGQLGAVDLNFNGWGRKQRHRRDQHVAERVSDIASAEHIVAKIVGEGGGIEVDGEGTAIITESCFVIDNRNPGLSRDQIESELKALFGLQKIIWLPGIRGKDITDGHTDFYARFVGPGKVVAALDPDPESFDYDVTRRHLQILQDATDAHGRALDVTTLEAPHTWRSRYDSRDFAPGYVNYYVANGLVVAPEFGDAPRDEECREKLERLYPDRDVVQLNIDAIASGGGGIHCTTQQEPRPLTD